MKCAIIIIDGAADRPLAELDGKTPLEAAEKPAIDRIATEGKIGTSCNVPAGMHPGSDVAILSLLGYDPLEYYTGRAPLEAAARGLSVPTGTWIFRCNLVTIVDGVMIDHSAGHISTAEGTRLIEEMDKALGSEQISFYGGVSYRHLMTVAGEMNVKTTPPHDVLGEPADRHLPTGKGSKLLVDLIRRSQTLLADHEINAIRRDMGENVASSIWLWGEGTPPTLPSFQERFGIRAAVITAVDLIRGIAMLTGMNVIEVEGATGYVDTNYAGKGAAAVAALDACDLVIVHVEAPDECGHKAEAKLKTQAIADIDQHIVTPVLKRLKAEGDDWRILVSPDHPTPVELRTHTADPVPFAVAGKDIAHVVSGPLTEANAAESDFHVKFGHELMEFFLKPSRA